MPNVKSNVHDSFFKACLQHPASAKEMILVHLPNSLTRNMHLDTLKRMPTAFVSMALKNSAADVVYQVEYKGALAYIYLLFEHLSDRRPQPTKADALKCHRLYLRHRKGTL